MTLQQQQALDSFYALDNVITIKIKMPQADWDAVRNEEPAGGRCNFNFTGGSRYTWRKAASVEISGTRFPAHDHVRRRRHQEEIVLRIHRRQEAVPAHRLRQVRRCQRRRDRDPDRVALRDAQQFHSGQVVYQADAGLQVAGHGGVASFAMQLRPGVRQRNPDRRRGRCRQQPWHLRQRRADHEALHRAQLQRQHERKSVRNRAYGRSRRIEAGLHRGGIPVRVRRQSRSEVRVPPHQGERAGRRGSDARYGPVPQALRDGILPQALGRLRRQHEQHLSL